MIDSNILQNVALFNNLPPVEKEEIEKKSSVNSYKKYEFIFNTNEPANNLYFIKSGRVKIGSYSDSGKEVIKAILGENDVFGELSLLGESIRSNFAQSIEAKTEVVAINQNTLQLLMMRNKNMGIDLLKLIGNRLKKAEERLESIVFKDARSRVIDLLKEMAEKHGQRIGFETLIWNYLTHLEMANLTATSRQTVTTVLNDLKDKNLIYFDRKRILIRDMEKLK